jgi:hypothetical protein
MRPPARLPSLWEVRSQKLGDRTIGDHAWPCIKCWGAGCASCDGTGEGPRAQFYDWYQKLYAISRRALQEYFDDLDADSQCIVGTNFYDMEYLRKVSRRKVR